MYSERELIRKLRERFPRRRASGGIGDDTAILDSTAGFSTLFCSDMLVEHTHFARDTHPAESIGFKAIAVNVSDIGAMGGAPESCVLSLAVPPDTPTDWIDRLLDGVASACSEFDVELVGGDTAAGQTIVLDVAMLGKVPSGQEVRRSGANPGDGIYVTGSLGAAARGLELLGKGDVEHPAAARQLCPRPRHRVGQRVRGNATAMIDVSDGLSTDLGHILEAGQVSARVYADLVPHSEDVPLDLALHGGEDYELIITGTRFPAEVCGIPLTRIGEILASEARGRAWIVSASGEQPLHGKGWQHFD